MATAPDIRFECRYCNKAINVPAKHGGARIKCPHCKNPVVVPAVEGAIASSYSTSGGDEKLNRVSNKAVKRGGGLSLMPLIKLAVLAAALYGAYLGYGWYSAQQQKTLAQLLEEMSKGNEAVIQTNAVFMQQKISALLEKHDGKLPDSETTTLTSYAKHEQASLRRTVLEQLGRSANAKSRSTLLTAMKQDKDDDVRRLAAIALGDLGYDTRDKSLIDELIGRLEQEKVETVKGGIHNGLRTMTGNTEIKQRDWKTWWNTESKRFSFPKKKPIR
jgi:phage FluMu protein Com